MDDWIFSVPCPKDADRDLLAPSLLHLACPLPPLLHPLVPRPPPLRRICGPHGVINCYVALGVLSSPITEQGAGFALNGQIPLVRQELNEAAARVVRLFEDAKRFDEAQNLRNKFIRQWYVGHADAMVCYCLARRIGDLLNPRPIDPGVCEPSDGETVRP